MAVGIVGAFPDAGGVPDVGHLSEVVVGELPSGSSVIVGGGDEFSCKGSILIRCDKPPGFDKCLLTVELVIGFGNTGTVGISLFQFQPRGLVIEPDGGISVGLAGRIGSDVAFVCTEGSQGHHAVGFVVGEAGRLNDGAIFGRLSAADVVGIAGSASQAVGDGSHGIAAGKVAGGGHGAGCVRDLDSTSCKIRFLHNGVAATIGFFQNHPCRGAGTPLDGTDSGVVGLAYGKAVYDKRLGYNIRSGNAAEPGAFGRSGILRPLDALLPVDVCGDGFVFQNCTEPGNHILRGLSEGATVGIVGSGSVHLVDAVFPNPEAG